MSLTNVETIKKLYEPTEKKTMQMVVFGSGSGTNLEALFRAQRELRSASGQPLFEVKALFTDRRCRFHEIAEWERVPLIYHSFIKFFKERDIKDKKDRQTRIEYDRKNVELIETCAKEHNFSVDLIFLAGYMRLLFPPLLEHFRDKILNVHPADLTATDEEGNRRYVGDNAVYDALMNGETRTRSSVILIDENVDTGPIIVSGPWISYTEGFPVTFKRAAYQQDKQKTLGDWPACIKAVELIAEGRVGIDDNSVVYLDNIPQSKGGYILENNA